jgi:hypothetical protein
MGNVSIQKWVQQTGITCKPYKLNRDISNTASVHFSHVELSKLYHRVRELK